MVERKLDPTEVAIDIVGRLFDSMECDGHSAERKKGKPNREIASVDASLQSASASTGFSHHPEPKPSKLGIVAWTDPWHISGWEMTEEFVIKWSFLFKGCAEMLAVTNGWRAKRGDEPIAIPC